MSIQASKNQKLDFNDFFWRCAFVNILINRDIKSFIEEERVKLAKKIKKKLPEE